MTGYDIIGDVHGCATKLRALLGELGYRHDRSGAYRHPDRTAVFVGDLIDRGDEQPDFLQIVHNSEDRLTPTPRAGRAAVAAPEYQYMG